MKMLAHSSKNDIPAQDYTKHILNVRRNAVKNIIKALKYFSGDTAEKEHFKKAVEYGALFHDLGKIDKENQLVLQRINSRKKLPLNHCDAGTSLLLRNKAVNAALLTYSHHAGLFSLSEELKKKDGDLAFRDIAIASIIDANLNNYEQMHNCEVGSHDLFCDAIGLKGFSLRLALSSLVDADHHDTACNYKNESDIPAIPTQWDKRLSALKYYVENLNSKSSGNKRNKLRDDIFNACLNAPLAESLKYCDAPVGSGKTTAVMAYLLRLAKKKELRHIFVVLPYTNIIQQSVDVYRKSLVLEGENPEEIVAAHYHQADFSNLNSRHLAALWNAPIIVTSAVQFFETIAGSSTARLRKLHELPGSAIFVDEAHAVMPIHLWVQQWEWMIELVKKWTNCFVFASGSLVKFWEFSQITTSQYVVNSLLPEEISVQADVAESERIYFPQRSAPLDRYGLINLIISKSGPRLVILNTVQSAAVIAHEMKKKGCQVIHLSTALAPIDRNKIIDSIEEKLKDKTQNDWTLVATSCVEAGMDFSFKTAFRESCSVTSLIQISGRVNRHSESITCEVIDFRTIDPLLNRHPAFEVSRLVLDDIAQEDLLNNSSVSDISTEALRKELGKNSIIDIVRQIKKSEHEQNYKDVAKLCRIITADTRTVVVSSNVLKRLKSREKVTSQELLNNSVQIWSTKIAKLDLQPLDFYDDIYSLGSYTYDPNFLGYMEGMLPQIYKDEDGYII